jgi:type IV pilus assembly protein PilO
VLKNRGEKRNGSAQPRNPVSPLNLHWAGVGLLVLVNLYLLVQMLFLWHASSNYNAEAMAQQRVALQRAQVVVQPLRGLDTKLSVATAKADKFYQDRLPTSDSEIAAELGALTKKAGVRLAGAGYSHAAVLSGSSAELTELRIDARMSGDYRPLVQFLNSLERDKMFFVINGVILSGQQSGTVNLRLKLTTYLRGGAAREQADTSVPTADGAVKALPVSAGGAR